jgi:hypothetical protein
MLAVMEGTRVQAADAHAAWSESFNELIAQVAEREVTGGVFVGYGVVMGLAGESGYVIAGQPWLGTRRDRSRAGRTRRPRPRPRRRPGGLSRGMAGRR